MAKPFSPAARAALDATANDLAQRAKSHEQQRARAEDAARRIQLARIRLDHVRRGYLRRQAGAADVHKAERDLETALAELDAHGPWRATPDVAPQPPGT